MPRTQLEPSPGTVQNNAGGYSHVLPPEARLQRFLILGSDGGTYYVKSKDLTKDNLAVIEAMLPTQGKLVVDMAVDVSVSAIAPKNDAAIFTIAVASKLGDLETRRYAREMMRKVCRTGTHLFQFTEYVDMIGGWGRGTKRAIGDWYGRRSLDDLAYQLVKYQSRGGWSNRDVMRLAHPKPKSPAHDALYKWAVGKHVRGTMVHPLIEAFEHAKEATTVAEIVSLIVNHRLPREAIPSQWLSEPAVWHALLGTMPAMALVRNLANMTRLGVITNDNQAGRLVAMKIEDPRFASGARLHPIALLNAMNAYQRGRSLRDPSKSWGPVTRIVDALDSAFYSSFGSVEPTGKRTVVALDVSRSMMDTPVFGLDGLDCATASVAMAMVTAAVEADVSVNCFTTTYRPLDVSPRRRMDDNLQVARSMPFSGTDCALPITDALRKRQEVDTFIVYTDSETWAGPVTVTDALARYRREINPKARMVVVGMASTGFTIADPNDAGSLDVVGFDTAAPQVISEFAQR